MEDDPRPNPDAILAAIHSEEEKARRGRLRIFFGMCPGVGKTYAMLEAAQRKLSEGVEVVVGVVETHGRSETQALLNGMPVVPAAKLLHRGVELSEMDLDGILLWHPQIALVDELAHTNAPGSRHPKRYQDVLELLDAGVDVFTTLNVQHVESRIDAVRQFTGVAVRETVPDSLLDIADEIELVDLTPEKLRQRLKEGKVYRGDRAGVASDNFFREGNLAALREMVLRLTAEHVDRRIRDLQPASQLGASRSGDRFLVGVSAGPRAAELIRWTRRYAAGLDAPWVAVAVETSHKLGSKEERLLAVNLAFARQLGGEVVLTSGTHVGEALLRVAREHRVTQIVLGKPAGIPWLWLLRHRSPVAWLIRHSGGIDLQLVCTEAGNDEVTLPPVKKRPGWFRHYAVSLGISLGATLASLLLEPFVGYWSVALIYLLTVTVAGATLRRGPTLLLAAINALVWNWLFIPPKFTFFIRAPQDMMMFAMFFVVAMVVGHLTTRLRERELLEHRLELRATALYQLTRKLAATTTRDEAVREVLAQIKRIFDLDAAAYLRDESGQFEGTAHQAGDWVPKPLEEGVAAWAFQKKRPAGRGTDAVPEAEGLYLPLVVADWVEGVLAIRMGADVVLEPAQRELLDAFASQLAIVAEVQRLAHAQRRAQVLAESERLQKTLFDSVSHELKTPIAAIRAALEQPKVEYEEVRKANDRLSRAVEHLLSATRIESGMVKPVPEWCDPVELAREACAVAAVGARIALAPALSLPLIRVDPGLSTQALVTLLENALTHGASAQTPTFAVTLHEGFVCFEIRDFGHGLPIGMEEKVFTKFFRLPGAPAGGVGLGLSIARQFAEIQGGTLMGRNGPGGGALFTLSLPIGGEPKIPE